MKPARFHFTKVPMNSDSLKHKLAEIESEIKAIAGYDSTIPTVGLHAWSNGIRCAYYLIRVGRF